MENFFKTILDFFLLIGGIILAAIALVLICLMLFGKQNTNSLIFWIIALGMSGCGLIFFSIRSLKRNTEDEDE
jgi:Na+/melibiose symporter-like transporter